MTAPEARFEDIVAFLSDPAAYGAAGPVERAETHASIVFLVGADAYKLKKPVAFGYMDFSTLERRRANCEVELALNRRTAPELYLGVVPVTRQADGQFALGGAGEPVEWLVHMRRFDQGCVLAALAEREGLDPPLLAALADAVAAFHAAAERRPDHGGAAAWRQVIDHNDRELRTQIPRTGTAAEVAELRARSLALVDRHAALIERRRLAGYVRRCHGDLHLGNVCRIGGRPVLFDALEFDEALASIDILYDLAFLLMDLWQRGLRAAANLVLNRYILALPPGELAAFGEGLALLPLCLATRAAVRAHVLGNLADAAAQARAAGHLRLALDFLAPAPPRLVAVGGLSGSGKSTAAAAVAPALMPAPGALILRTDALRKARFGAAPQAPLPESAYAPEISARIYADQLAAAERALHAGHSVVLDAVFARPEERRAAAALARRIGVPFQAFWLDVPRDIMRERLARRRGDVSDATPAILDRQLGYDIGPLDWTRIDASGTAADSADRIAQVLGGTAAAAPAGRPGGEQGGER